MNINRRIEDYLNDLSSKNVEIIKGEIDNYYNDGNFDKMSVTNTLTTTLQMLQNTKCLISCDPVKLDLVVSEFKRCQGM